jgi:hypothetical protein
MGYFHSIVLLLHSNLAQRIARLGVWSKFSKLFFGSAFLELLWLFDERTVLKEFLASRRFCQSC